MSLQNWLQIGHLTNHQATIAEIRKILGVVDRELADASVTGLSDDGRFTHAYDAALLLCKLALHASGFELQKRVPGHHAMWINFPGIYPRQLTNGNPGFPFPMLPSTAQKSLRAGRRGPKARCR